MKIKNYLNNYVYKVGLVGLGLLVLVASCRKESYNLPKSSSSEGSTSSNESLLYSIKEDGTLEIKSNGAQIVIYNSNTGSALGQGNNRYRIVASGKEYTFSSTTAFGARTILPLVGAIKVFQNDVLVFEEKYDFKNFHLCTTTDHVFKTKKSGNTTSGFGKSFWPNGSEIRVKFANKSVVSPRVKEKIIKYAKVWENYANIKFKFVDSSDNAQIIIALSNNYGPTYCSATGIEIVGQIFLDAAHGNHNMMYGWFNEYTSEEDFSRTVLHEFGHALGLIHEQSHPDANIDMRALWLYYYDQSSTRGAEAEAYADELIEQTKAFAGVPASHKYDPLSIMHYYVPASATHNHVAVNGNSIKLSAGDIDFVKSVYPFPNVVLPEPTSVSSRQTLFTLNGDAGNPGVRFVRDMPDLFIYLISNLASL